LQKITHGKDISHRKIPEEAEIQVARRSTLFSLRPQARLYEGFRPLPHLLPRIRERGRHSGHKEIIMVTDPISDLIIRIQNGSAAKKAKVAVIHSKFAENVAHALKKAGYVSTIEKRNTKTFAKELELGLVYTDGEPRVHGVERISKPSLRVYQKSSDIRMYRSGFGNTFLSTPKGIMADTEAKKHKVGGEVLFKIW
jgi:small subunit ribosomal protein S8